MHNNTHLSSINDGNLAFLDLSDGGPYNEDKICYLSYRDIINKIQKDTGRRLELLLPDGQDQTMYPNLVLVKLPEPIGYSIFSLRAIPADEFLFYYGGVCYSKLEDIPKSQRSSQYNLSLHCVDTVLYEDATSKGQLGSLAMHLPSVASLEQVGCQVLDNTVLTQNITIKPLNGRLAFYSAKATPAGVPLGYDYELNKFWGTLKISPRFVNNQGQIIPTNKLLFTNPLIRFVDIELGHYLWCEYYNDLMKDKLEVIAKLDHKTTVFYYSTIWMLRISLLEQAGSPIVTVPARNKSAEYKAAIKDGLEYLSLPSSLYANSINHYGVFRDRGLFSEGAIGNQTPSQGNKVLIALN